ncbi:MAG: V-type ATP synthase subunit E [Bacillota bacterium]
MSGVEKLKDRILEEARLQADANTKRAQDEAADIIEAAGKEAETKRKETIEKAKREAVEVKKRLIAVAELEARKERLKAKQEIVEEAFDKTLEKLNSLPDPEYQNILSDMIVNSVGSNSVEIVLSPKDKNKLSQTFIEDINKKLLAKGVTGSVRLADETRNINGGFILKSGDMEINYSFEAIIRMKRDEIESEVINSLF